MHEPGTYGALELAASARPLRPGAPGEAPFWNAYARRFIFAPAFAFAPVHGARAYRYEIRSLTDSSAHLFESDIPYAPLSPVWASIPVGNFQLTVTGISGGGETVGRAGEGTYHRAAPFNGPYHDPVLPYARSGLLALERALHKPFVERWLSLKAPDPSYPLYRYPAKIFAAVIAGAVAHARLAPDSRDAARSTALARIVADYLLDISFPAGSLLEHFPPTYHGEWIGRNPRSHAQLTNYMTIIAADAGHAYLDLHDHTGEERYLEAAQSIARTYLKNQLAHGSWYLYVNHETGEPTAGNIAIPTSTVRYFDRLRSEYGVAGLEEATRRALAWTMANPAKTFHWQAQFEDVASGAFAPYERMSREQACDLAMYLLTNRGDVSEDLELAEDLIRFAEDQFVTWEQPEDIVVAPRQSSGTPGRQILNAADAPAGTEPGWFARNWMTPTVHEQYGFWMPVARSSGVMLETYWHAYAATSKDVYLAKAKSLANNFTRVQREHGGDYPTMLTQHPMTYWLNNAIYPAKAMIQFGANLQEPLHYAVAGDAAR